jgi:hypothetical protein
MSNRRLIAMIRGRATAGDHDHSLPLAARPQVVSALSKMTFAVGAAGVVVVLAGTLGSSMLSAAAGAAVGGGRPYVVHHDVEPTVAGMAATPAVPVSLVLTPSTATTLAPLAPPAAPPVAAPPVAVPAVVRRAPAPPAPVVVAVAPAPGSVEAIIADVFGPNARAAIGVARCESHLNPGAISRGGGNWGLFQINRAHRARVEAMGYRWEDLLDARVNSLVAKSIFDEQGWRPWGCRAAAR